MAEKEQNALENQAIVLQQPNGEKIYLDLNVSTDTTAIKSFEKSADMSIAAFDYATGIAVFLALCATGLAYWFGVRSFKLTEMSFKVVSQDIQEAAQSHRETTRELISSQEKLKALEIQETRYKEIIEKICTLDGLRIETQVRVHMDTSKQRKLSEPSLTIYINNLTEMRQILIRLPHLFKIYFNKEDIEQDVIQITKNINSMLFELTEFSGQSHGESLSTYQDILPIMDKVSALIDKMHLYLKKVKAA